jgi:hypothetical protein
MSIFQHILTNAALYCITTTLKPKSKRKPDMKLDIVSVAILAMLTGLAVAQDVSIRCYHRPECCTNRLVVVLSLFMRMLCFALLAMTSMSISSIIVRL